MFDAANLTKGQIPISPSTSVSPMSKLSLLVLQTRQFVASRSQVIMFLSRYQIEKLHYIVYIYIASGD